LPSNHKGIFTEPLPSNDRVLFTEPLPISKRGIHTHTHTHTEQRDMTSQLLFFSK
jgi:hypothetical protein